MELKFCTKCEQHKPLEQFGKDKYKKSGKRNFCKSCEVRRVTAYNAEHIKEISDYKREYYHRHREHLRDLYRKNRQLKTEQYRATTRNAGKRYRLNHPEFINMRSTWGYKKKTNHPDIARLYQAQNGKCRYCDCELESQYQIDHIMPLQRGGSNDIENIALCCAVCNWSKGNKTLEEWRG